MTFQQALQRAAARPSLALARQALADRQARDRDLPAQAANPEFAAALGPALPFPAAAVQFSAAQPLSLANLPEKRRAAAAAERQAAEAEWLADTAAAQFNAGLAWLRLWVAQRRLELAAEEVAAAQNLADAATRAASLGAALAGDAAEGRAYAAEAKLARLAMLGQLRLASLGLQAAAALDAEDLPSADGPLPKLPVPPEEHAHLPKAVAPLAVAAEKWAAAEAARAHESQAQHGSQLAPGAMLQRDASGAAAALVTVTWRPAWYDKGQRAAAQNLHAQALADSRRQELQLAADVALHGALHEAEHSRETLNLLQTELLPASQAAVAARAAAFKRGTGPVADLIRARRALIDVQRRIADAQADVAAADFRAAVLTGALLSAR